MPQRESARIPWASLAVVATFVSGTLIVPKAFDLLRPPEKERAQQFSGADLEVDARLWEDPFGAVRRHESDRVERCKNPAAASKRECDAAQRDARRSPQALRAHLDADGDGRIDEQSSLLIAVLVPGNPFVGAEEARRRTRFALLSGLQAEGYFPDSAEQIGLMQVPLAPISALAPLTRHASHRQSSAAATAAASGGDLLQIPYELLSRSRNLRAADDPPAGEQRRTNARQPYQSVAVVWVDEAALPGPKLDGVARLLDTVIACRAQVCPRLAVIGPSSSDGLDLMLHGLEAALARRASAPESIDASLANGYRLLARAHFYSPAATISDEDLPLLRRYGMGLQEFFTSYFTGIVPERARMSAAEREVNFTRTIGADVTVVTLLASEVLQRLPSHGKRRVVTIVESDSIYARALERRMRHLLAHGSQISRIEQTYFFRGIDGVTARDGGFERQPPSAKGKGSSEAEAVEWPEARDQLDYLRRMAEDLKASENIDVAQGGGPIGAIGIFANDVHDKLLVLQALHDTFPDKVFFTTDMDARFVHPRVLPFTRNLVLASSLPLKMPTVTEPGADGEMTRTVRQIQEGTPPMRDVYQTAAYLSARMAACTRMCGQVERATQAAIQSPSVYEIGRNGAVAIGGYDASAQRQQQTGIGTAAALAAGLVVIVLGLLLAPSTPNLRSARARWLQVPLKPVTPAILGAAAGPPSIPGETPAQVSWMASVLTMGYGLWLGFAAASVLETAAPGSLDLSGALAWAALGAVAAGLLSPGLRLFMPGVASDASSAQRGRPLRVMSLLLLAALLAWAWWLAEAGQPGQGEPLRWLDGISGWPSHFLHLLAFLVVLVSMDLYGHRAGELTKSEALWLGMPAVLAANAAQGDRASWTSKAQDWLRRHALFTWHLPPSGSVDFSELWQRFQQLNEPGPRLVRVLFWYAITVAGATAFFVVLTGRYVPDVPVRGVEHRAIVITGLVAALAALPALVLAVADATLATCRLLLALGRGRTMYPPEVVARFARELGPELAHKMAQPLAANPGERGSDAPGAPERAGALDAPDRPNAAVTITPAHSLLDDWIGIQLVARQTQAVAPLIVAPFIVLGLLVLARSRLFDSWAVTWPLAATAAAYLLGLVGLAVALKLSAEKLRSDALARMRADLLWLGGAGQGREKLAEPLKQLIADVENNSTGALAPMLEQPLVAALMVPLGSAGGVQLFDHLLLAR